MTSVLIRDTENRHRREGNVKTVAEIGDLPQVKEAVNHQKLEKARNRSDPSGFQTPRLQKCERINFYYLKPQITWYFVTETSEN